MTSLGTALAIIATFLVIMLVCRAINLRHRP